VTAIIKILIAKFDTRLSVQMWDQHLIRLPEPMRTEVAKFHGWEDRQARLFGRLLLLEGLQEFGYSRDVLAAVFRDEFGRPNLDKAVDFNLTHSGGYVACALTADGKVGIDIEKIVPINIGDFDQCLTSEECGRIWKYSEPLKKFFEFWTQKESVLKADGRGLSIPMSEILINENKARLFMDSWFFQRIEIAPGYVCHLATNIENPEIIVRHVRFRQDDHSKTVAIREEHHG
jgi:4'-phosphopantetheinyl transferase